MDVATRPAGTGPLITLWLLRIAVTAHLVAVLAQPVLAGRYLTGDVDARARGGRHRARGARPARDRGGGALRRRRSWAAVGAARRGGAVPRGGRADRHGLRAAARRARPARGRDRHGVGAARGLGMDARRLRRLVAGPLAPAREHRGLGPARHGRRPRGGGARAPLPEHPARDHALVPRPPHGLHRTRRLLRTRGLPPPARRRRGRPCAASRPPRAAVDDLRPGIRRRRFVRLPGPGPADAGGARRGAAVDGGRVGDVVLVNGAPWPVCEVDAARYRLRILNAS